MISSFLTSFLRKVALGVIRLYQLTFSALLGRQCRFTPSCSAYAKEAFETLPLGKAFILSFKRIIKCNPWGPSGYDPVPKHVIKKKSIKKRT